MWKLERQNINVIRPGNVEWHNNNCKQKVRDRLSADSFHLESKIYHLEHKNQVRNLKFKKQKVNTQRLSH